MGPCLTGDVSTSVKRLSGGKLMRPATSCGPMEKHQHNLDNIHFDSQMLLINLVEVVESILSNCLMLATFSGISVMLSRMVASAMKGTLRHLNSVFTGI